VVQLLKDGLIFWNPWWNNKTDIFKTLKMRPCINNIKPLFNRKEILAITGVRRSGKTSLIYLLIKETLKKVKNNQVLYINLDDPTFKDTDFDKIYEAYEELMIPTEIRYLFFDEVQNIQNWEKWVKKIYDSLKNVKIVVSGSNSSLLKSEYSKYLVGRNLTYELYPLSFLEYIEFNGLDVSSEAKLLATKTKIKHLLDEYLRYGGFPEVVLEKNKDLKYTLLKEYFNAILARDILTRYEIKERKKLEQLAIYLLTNISNMTSAKSQSSVVGLNIRTVQEYFNHLEDVYLLFFVNHYSYSLKAQYTYPRKAYCVDTGLRSAVSFRFSEDIGRLIENLVYLNLRQKGEIYYWKDSSSELDFVVKKGVKITQLIQVCYDIDDPKTKKREMKGLINGMKYFNLRSGTIITWDYEDSEKMNGKVIEFIPLWKWLLE